MQPHDDILMSVLHIECIHSPHAICANTSSQVDFWDTGSAERYRGSLTGNYYKGATGIILMYDATDPSSLTSLRTWMEDAQSYTFNATFLLLGNKYDNDNDSDSGSGSTYQVDDDLSNAFAMHKEIPLHFKISAQCSDEETLMNVFQSLAEQMHREMERQYYAGGITTRGDYPLTCTCTDTVALFATENTNTHSSCTLCSRR